MNTGDKMRVVADYETLAETLKEQIKLTYPTGFSEHLISFLNKEGKTIKGLRFETDDKIYLLRMTILEAEALVEEDDDFDDDGNLHDDIREEYEEKYADDYD